MKKEFMLYGYSSNTDGTWYYGDYMFDQGVDFRTVEKYKEYLDCGLNTLMLQGNDPYLGEDWETSQTKKNMDNAYTAGIQKVVLFDKRIYDYSTVKGGIVGEGKAFETQEQLEDFIADCIKDYRTHPAYYGFMLIDEPSWECFKSIAQIMEATRVVSPETYVQCNLLPLYNGMMKLHSEGGENMTPHEAFGNYIRTYLEMTGSSYVKYDSYPMRAQIDEGFFILRYHLPGLQISLDICKEMNREFGLVMQAQAYYTNHKLRFRKPEEADMRWQMNCALAFGIKVMAYFTYWRKQRNDVADYVVDNTSFCTQDGRKTQLYYDVQKIHKELNEIAEYLLGCRYENSSYYTDMSTAEPHVQDMQKRDFSCLLDLETSENATLVVTKLKHQPTGETVVCIFNANDPKGTYPTPTTIKATFKGKLLRAFSLKDPKGQTVKDEWITLNAGDSMFFVIDE